MRTFEPISRRRFLTTTATLASTLQLQRAAHALGFVPRADVCKLTSEQEVGPYYVGTAYRYRCGSLYWMRAPANRSRTPLWTCGTAMRLASTPALPNRA